MERERYFTDRSTGETVDYDYFAKKTLRYLRLRVIFSHTIPSRDTQ